MKKMKAYRTPSVDRSKAPKGGPPGEISFPKYTEKKYRNGFKLFVVENHQLPVVTAGFVVRNGAAYDGGLPGLSSITCELLTKGTKKRNATRIAEEIDFVGGSLSHSVSWDSSQLFVAVLKNHLKKGFDLLEDVALNPSFPEEEIRRVKVQRVASIQQMKADPAYLAETAFASVLFGSHPYAHPPGGTEKSVPAMRRDDMVNFHRRYYTPDNSFIVFAGDITPAEAERLVSRRFAKWKARATAYSIPAPEETGEAHRVFVAHKKGAVQSSLRIGHVGVTRRNPDFLKIFVMNTLLGGYFSSRINMNLREVHGYTYGGRSEFDARTLPGVFQVSADVRNEVTVETIDEIVGELKRIREALPSREELKMVKNYLAGLFPIQLETPQQVAGRVIATELYHLPKTYYRNYRTNIARVTGSDIRAVARKYIHPERLFIVLSGDSKVISAGLEKFGRVEVIQ